MIKLEKHEKSAIEEKKLLNRHYYISPQKTKFHGFSFLITNIKNFGLKKNKISINKLLNSSKYMLRDNNKYKSCFDLSRNFHFYPYRPEFPSFSSDKKLNALSSSIEDKKNKIILKDNLIEEKKKIAKINLLQRKKISISPIPNHKIPFNKYISNKNSNKSLYNIYNNDIKAYKLKNKIDDYDIIFLHDSLKNLNLTKNNFTNNENLEKISFYKFDSLSMKIKLSGLCLKFYEFTKKKKKSILSINNFNCKKISKIKFPFEFIYFFYGINLDAFLIFIIKVIEYNHTKNNFELNFEKFFENFNSYKINASFYDLNSFIEKYDNNKIKEYFRYFWDVNIDNGKDKDTEKGNVIENEGNNSKNFLVKVQLPKMTISIENNIKRKSIFYSNIEIDQLCYFLKNNFLNWDQYILNYFSEFKLFRFVKNNLLSADKNYFEKINLFNKNFNNIKDLKTIRYNMNKTNIILNNIKANNKSYEFFYTNYKAGENSKKENYFFQLILPKINIIYKDNNSSINKQFDLDIKTMTKLNRLRKSFNRKDIIKYSIIYIKGKNTNSKISKNSSIKRINSNHENLNKKNSNKNLSKFSLKYNAIDNIKQITKKPDGNNEDVVDIKLNLNENIFNFDEDILKYIKVDKEKNDMNSKYNINDKTINNINIMEDNQDKKLNIEIEKIQLNWLNSNNDDKNIYKFEDNESEYLFDHSSLIWRKYIEKNIDKIISSSIPESQIIVTPSLKNSSSTIKISKYIK